jgi:hypothetical protein
VSDQEARRRFAGAIRIEPANPKALAGLKAMFLALGEPLECGHPLQCLPDHEPGQVVVCGWCDEVGRLREMAAEHQRAITELAVEYNRRDEDRKALRQQVATLTRERDEARHEVDTEKGLRLRAEARERAMQARERSEWNDEQDAIRRSRDTP